MCMFYKGVAYPYAFEFNNVPIRNDLRKFRIVISEYREATGDFSGLCFENELKVTSDIRLPYGAFFEIVNKIVNITKEGEQFYMDNHDGQVPKPMLSVTDHAVLDLFEKRKKTRKSLEYYEQLKRYVEKPESILLEDLSIEQQLDICDRMFILVLTARIRKEAPDYSNFAFFRT